MEIEVFQKVASLKDSHPAPSILEHPAFSLDLVLDANIVVVLFLGLVALPHTVLGLDLEVKFRVAVHYCTLLDQALERTDLHRNSEGAIG